MKILAGIPVPSRFFKQVTHYLNAPFRRVKSIFHTATITAFKNSRAGGTNGLYVGDILPT